MFAAAKHVLLEKPIAPPYRRGAHFAASNRVDKVFMVENKARYWAM